MILELIKIFFLIYNIILKILKINKDVCKNNPNPCGTGAICTNNNGAAVCSCPAGKNGDPKVRCCGIFE
jgi:hypothetical protein